MDWRDGWFDGRIAPGRTADVFCEQVGTAVTRSKRHGRVAFVITDSRKLLLLHLLHSVGLATPTPYHLDQSGEIFSTPYVILEYIEGKPEFAPSNLTDLILQLATHLSRIHHVDCSRLDVSFLPQQEQKYAEKLRERPTNVDDSVDERHIRDALEAVWPLPQRNTSVLLHGDFWPGNLLWQDGQLVAVIDWEHAALGDPLADVANSRLEILWAFGIEAMHSFTHQYQAMTTIDFTNLPYWDLCAALRQASTFAAWVADDSTEKTMREGHRWFITQAFEKLSFSRGDGMKRRSRALIERVVRFHGILHHRIARRFGQFTNYMHCFERNIINGYYARIELTRNTAC